MFSDLHGSVMTLAKDSSLALKSESLVVILFDVSSIGLSVKRTGCEENWMRLNVAGLHENTTHCDFLT